VEEPRLDRKRIDRACRRDQGRGGDRTGVRDRCRIAELDSGNALQGDGPEIDLRLTADVIDVDAAEPVPERRAAIDAKQRLRGIAPKQMAAAGPEVRSEERRVGKE